MKKKFVILFFIFPYFVILGLCIMANSYRLLNYQEHLGFTAHGRAFHRCEKQRPACTRKEFPEDIKQANEKQVQQCVEKNKPIKQKNHEQETATLFGKLGFVIERW